LIVGCDGLPSLEGRRASHVVADTADTRLGKSIAPMAEAHPGRSGIYPLSDAHDAFAARVLLARAAERTLDVQYYIWHHDRSGMLLFKALREAADRGVRVRLLLDDNNTSALDATLSALDAHPNIEVRLFNPFATRRVRALGYLTDFSRLNRRMHNKSFTADSQATIVGGRNVGDEYFGASTESAMFVDLDVLAVGPVVRQVSDDFDRYWASESSYPADRVLPPVDAAQKAELEAAGARMERDPASGAYLAAVREAPFVRQLMERRLPLEWAPTRMVSDDPAKGLGRGAPDAEVSAKLKMIVGDPGSDVQLVSAYFVPTEAGVASFTQLAARGVKIRVLTNSLEATDVAAVHAGYAKRRKALLQAGVALYELRRLSGPAEVRSAGGVMGSSTSSLHAKTFSVDGSRIFVGSFNFDPRSARLNTEMGFVIDSQALAQRVDTLFDHRVPDTAYEVRLGQNGQLYWIERRGGAIERYDTEPGASLWRRAGVAILSVLPIEWLL
jgi:putative cardiolipin synthase